MQVHDLEWMINGRVQLAMYSERLGQVSCFHHRRDSTFPRDIRTDDVHDPAGDALGGGVMRPLQDLRSTDWDVELPTQFSQ